MAEEQTTSSAAAKSDRQVVWLAVAGLACLLLLACFSVGLAFFMGRNQPLISINAGNHSQTGTAAGAPAQAIATPSVPTRAVDPGAHRGGQQTGAPRVLPGPPYDANIGRGRRATTLNRSEDQGQPYYMTSKAADSVLLRVRRRVPNGPGDFNGPVPSRMRNWNAAPDGRVSSVEARVPAAEDPEAFSYLPEIIYKPSAGHGAGLQVWLENPRKTSAVNALRAPKGFQFFVADIIAKNLGANPISMEPDMFEVQDSDGVPYLPNPELLSADFPQSPIGSQASARFTAAFLVPADASLVALVAREPGDGLISSPLIPQ